MSVVYLTSDKIIGYNTLAITLIKAKRADTAKVLSRTKIDEVLVACKAHEGDVHDKAVVLLCGLVQSHAFASGNRRTAFIATKAFLLINKQHFAVKNDPAYVPVMQGIRENYYTHDEIKEWIRHGTIKPFKR